MITIDMVGKVRRMRMRDKLSISEIAKTTRLSRNTIKKWLKEPGDVEPKYQRSSPPGKLTAYMPTLEQCLKTESHRVKHARSNGRALFKQIQAQGPSTQTCHDCFGAGRSYSRMSGLSLLEPANFLRSRPSKLNVKNGEKRGPAMRRWP